MANGRVLLEQLKPKPIAVAVAVAQALGVRPPPILERSTLIKCGKPVASAYRRRF